MDQFIEFLTQNDPHWGGVIFLMAMSVGLAIFHTVIFGSLLGLKFNIKLFFITNPFIILVCALIDTRWAPAALLFLTVSVFISAIIGMIVAGRRSNAEEKKEIEAFYNQYQRTSPSKIAKRIFSILFLAGIGAGFYFIGGETILFVIVFFIATAFLIPTNKSRFLKYQAILPLSKIRSVSMGLAEIQGKVKIIEPLISPVSNTDCAGFFYEIEDINRDKDGRDSYTTIFSETICNRFIIEDDTGSIEINPKKIEFAWPKNSTQKTRSGKRYSENLLQEGDEVLLIGRASVDTNNKPVMEYDSFRKVLAIAPSDAVINFNTNKPLRNSFIFFSCIYFILMAVVLITPIEIDGNKIIVNKPDWALFHFTPENNENKL
jgi:hypothetical protein